MWKWIGGFVVFYVVSHMLIDWLKDRNAPRADTNMTKIVSEMQSKLPMMISQWLRVDKVGYENRTIHFTGNLVGDVDLTSQNVAGMRNFLRLAYCRESSFVKNDIGVVYEVFAPARSAMDTTKKFFAEAKPQDCAQPTT